MSNNRKACVTLSLRLSIVSTLRNRHVAVSTSGLYTHVGRRQSSMAAAPIYIPYERPNLANSNRRKLVVFYIFPIT